LVEGGRRRGSAETWRGCIRRRRSSLAYGSVCLSWDLFIWKGLGMEGRRGGLGKTFGSGKVGEEIPFRCPGRNEPSRTYRADQTGQFLLRRASLRDRQLSRSPFSSKPSPWRSVVEAAAAMSHFPPHKRNQGTTTSTPTPSPNPPPQSLSSSFRGLSLSSPRGGEGNGGRRA
jgi:hypothetical protein